MSSSWWSVTKAKVVWNPTGSSINHMFAFIVQLPSGRTIKPFQTQVLPHLKRHYANNGQVVSFPFTVMSPDVCLGFSLGSSIGSVGLPPDFGWRWIPVVHRPTDHPRSLKKPAIPPDNSRQWVFGNILEGFGCLGITRDRRESWCSDDAFCDVTNDPHGTIPRSCTFDTRELPGRSLGPKNLKGAAENPSLGEFGFRPKIGEKVRWLNRYRGFLKGCVWRLGTMYF